MAATGITATSAVLQGALDIGVYTTAYVRLITE